MINLDASKFVSIIDTSLCYRHNAYITLYVNAYSFFANLLVLFVISASHVIRPSCCRDIFKPLSISDNGEESAPTSASPNPPAAVILCSARNSECVNIIQLLWENG